MSQKITVLLVDEDDAWRQELRAAVDAGSGVQLLGEAGSEAGALALLDTCTPDVILLGADRLHLADAQCVARLAACAPRSKVLVLSQGDSPDCSALDVFRAGACGYLLKDSAVQNQSPPTHLLEAIRVVSRGGAFLSPGLAGWLLDEIALLHKNC
jgi:DNA-binding NarL/FixJ family response regulator